MPGVIEKDTVMDVAEHNLAEKQVKAESMSLAVILRTATHDSHRALEAVPLCKRLLSKNASIDDYQCFLTTFLYVHRAIESAVEKNGSLHKYLPDITERSRVQALEHDIAHLAGGTIPPDKYHAHPITVSDSLPELFGCLYVVEGATLGGQVILKTLQAHSILPRHSSHKFLLGYGSSTKRKWKAFQEALDLPIWTASEREHMITAACSLFSDTRRLLMEYDAELQ